MPRNKMRPKSLWLVTFNRRFDHFYGSTDNLIVQAPDVVAAINKAVALARRAEKTISVRNVHKAKARGSLDG